MSHVPLPAPSLERLERAAAEAEGRPGEKKRMLVIANPYASTMSARLKSLVVYALQGRYDVEAVDTQRRAHAMSLSREASDGSYDVVCAFGGDGTVNEVANGLAGSPTAMTCLPGGATNVYCRMLGIPNDVVDATEHLLRLADDWRPRKVDLGVVSGRYFTFSAGMGLDASVVERVDRHPKLKAKYGPLFFTEKAIAVFLRRYVVNPPRLQIEVEGRTIEGVSAFVQNGNPYTFFRSRPIQLADGADLDSGDLAGVVLERANPADMPTVLWRAFSRRAKIERHRRVAAFHGVDGVVVRSLDDRGIPVQVDGDFIGELEEAVFSVAPGALRVLA